MEPFPYSDETDDEDDSIAIITSAVAELQHNRNGIHGAPYQAENRI